MQIRKPFGVNATMQVRSQNSKSWSGWEAIFRAKTLYDNTAGTTGTVTLNETSANFSYLEIFLSKDSDSGEWNVRVYSPNGKKAQVGRTYTNATINQVIGKTVTISGTSITQNAEGYFNLNLTSAKVDNVGTQTTLKIVKVVGYR